jgi:hypothetical protein
MVAGFCGNEAYNSGYLLRFVVILLGSSWIFSGQPATIVALLCPETRLRLP